MYACSDCGYVVNKRKIIKRRVDSEGHHGPPVPTPPFHGYVYEWKCPKCGNLKYINEEKDKE